MNQICTPDPTTTTTTNNEAVARRRRRSPLTALHVLVGMATLIAGLALTTVAASPASAQETSLNWTGQMAATMTVTNVYGQVVDTPTYANGAIITLAEPQNGERNPFFLHIGTGGNLLGAGETTVRSSATVAAPSGSFGVEYWQYEMVSDTRFEGVLIDAHVRESIAYNLVNIPTEIAPHIPMVMPYAMVEGTTIVGQFSPDYSVLEIRIDGNTTDGAHPFSISMQGQLG